MNEHKEPHVRKGEILDAAERLFLEKGYAKTTVVDILNVHGLSKGVFYYYFKSKEEVMGAIIVRIVDAMVLNANDIAANPKMTPPEKLAAIIAGQGESDKIRKDKKEFASQFHMAGNAEMHQKSQVHSIKCLAPIIAGIFQDIGGGCSTETAALLLSAGNFIFDEGLFHWTGEERARYASAFLEMMERTLGAAPGYFNEIKKILNK